MKQRTFKQLFCSSRSYSTLESWGKLKPIGLDSIKQLTRDFKQDDYEGKVLLGEGVYKNNEGKPHTLKSVRMAEKIIYDKELDHEYAPVSGVPEYCRAAKEFAFGSDNPVLDQTATVQAISGTGALRLGASFIKNKYDGPKVIYLPNPSWVNHSKIFEGEGIEVKSYRYFDPKTNGLDEEGFLEDLANIPAGSVVLFHACAHNPTGVDPSQDVWKKASKICKESDVLVFFDSAYQGFASGDPEKDAFSFRQFVKDGHQPIVAQSFSKNFGMYGERVGALQVVCQSPEQATIVEGHLMVLIRSNYSNPPIFGARIVSTVLDDPELKAVWEEDVHEMADRIHSAREGLVEELKNQDSEIDWSHITDQIGMFAYSGLTTEQVEQLKKDYHIYMTGDGRMSISGLNTKNIEYVAKGIHEVTKE